MRKPTSFLFTLFSLFILTSSFIPVSSASNSSVIPEQLQQGVSQAFTILEAEAAQGGPSAFQLSVRDLGCSAQQAYSAPASYTPPSGLSQAYATDSNAKDPDCIQILMDAGNTTLSGGSMYTNDFRLGVRLAESESGCTRDQGSIAWTPWATEGGGVATGFAQANINDADCVWIYYQTRTNPEPGVRITDLRVGVAAGWGPMQYTSWASAGGGASGFSTASSGGFTSARIALEPQLNLSYNADYTSTTIPQTPSALSPNVGVDANIVMENIPDVGASSARPWISDQIVSSTTNQGTNYCSDWEPTGVGQTCTQTTVYSSTKFKLRRIDSHTSAVQTTGGDLTYQRTVVSQYVSAPVYLEICVEIPDEPGNGGGGDGDGPPLEPPIVSDRGPSKLEQFAHALLGIKTAQAYLECTIDTNTVVGYTPSYSSQNQPVDVLQNDTAEFDLTVTGLVNGTYELQFQMVNTETNELFGDENAPGNANTIARINVTVGAAWAMSCGANQTVIIGDDAYYTITALGATLDVNVTMASNPAGASMLTSPLVLSGKNSYTEIAVVPTASLTPNQTYVLTFTGDDGVNQPVLCSVNLTVGSGTPEVEIYFNGSSGPVVLSGNQTSGTISWTVQNASSCTATTLPDPNTVTPAWSGSVSASGGSQAVSGLEFNTAYTFAISCTGPGGSDVDSVDVSSVPQNPAGDLYCKQGLTPNRQSCTANYGENGYLHWDTNFTTSCSISDNNPSLPDLGSVPLNQSQASPMLTGNLTQTTTFTLTCPGVSGTTPLVDNLTITVNANPDYRFDVIPFADTVNQGASTATFADVYSPEEGFNSNVTISVVSICPSGGGSCVSAGTIPSIVSLINATQSSPYSTDTTINIDSSLLSVDDYIFTFAATSASGVPSQKTDTYTLTVNAPTILNPPETVTSNNSVCGQVSITWTAPNGSVPSYYQVYRRLNGDTGPGALIHTTSDANPPLTFTDTTGVVGSFYQYGVSAMYGAAESITTWATAIEYSACEANFDGSYKKIVGAGTGPASYTPCGGQGGGFSLSEGQIYESGDQIFFEICVRNGGNTNLNNVSVTELINQNLNLENEQFVSAEGTPACATGSGSGPYTIGTLVPGGVCSILVRATISDPGGPASSLNWLTNFASLTATEASATVNVTANFIIGAAVPDRNEIPR